jgi:hypothetical protein
MEEKKDVVDGGPAISIFRQNQPNPAATLSCRWGRMESDDLMTCFLTSLNFTRTILLQGTNHSLSDLNF